MALLAAGFVDWRPLAHLSRCYGLLHIGAWWQALEVHRHRVQVTGSQCAETVGDDLVHRPKRSGTRADTRLEIFRQLRDRPGMQSARARRQVDGRPAPRVIFVQGDLQRPAVQEAVVPFREQQIARRVAGAAVPRTLDEECTTVPFR